jgi:hypothetical protein
MQKFDNNMRGCVYINRGRKKDTHPEYSGTCSIDGKEYWISGWNKASNNVGGLISLAFKIKDDKSGNEGTNVSKSSQLAQARQMENPDFEMEDSLLRRNEDHRSGGGMSNTESNKKQPPAFDLLDDDLPF